MDRIDPANRVLEFLKKYRYVLLVLAVGIILMCIPSGGEVPDVPNAEDLAPVTVPDLEARLEEILSQISGAGRVRVLLTEGAGQTVVYQADEDTSDTSQRRDTVIISGDQGDQGLVQQVLPPRYQGAVVVCQGGDSPTVRLAIVEAVSNATGLGADKISVLKMK